MKTPLRSLKMPGAAGSSPASSGKRPSSPSGRPAAGRLARFDIRRCLPALLVVLGLLPSLAALAADPVVSNVRASQRAGTQLVDIYYDLADSDSSALTVSMAVSDNAGATYTVPATSFSGAVGNGVAPGSNRKITWNAGADWPNKFSSNVRFRVTASDDTAPSGMALIPAGNFTMGDNFNDSDISWGERPTHSVYVSAFYMDRTEVTKALWDEVYQWAVNRPVEVRYGPNLISPDKGKTHMEIGPCATR